MIRAFRIVLFVSLFLTLSLSFISVFAIDDASFGVCTNDSHPTDEKLDVQVDMVIDRVTDPEMSDVEKLRGVYDWVLQNIRYSGSVYIDLEKNTFDSQIVDMVWYALNYREGSCYHWAALCQYMLERLGFTSVVLHAECSSVTGGWTEHYWTYVYYDGEWYHFDPMMEKLVNGRDCFMTVDSVVRDKWHHWEDGAFPPSAAEPLKYK